MSIMLAQPNDSNQTPTSVYRYYDHSRVLLYVGVTSRGVSRNIEHNKDKDWWQFVTGQTVEHFPDRRTALAREKALIRQYRPPFNTQHNPDHEDTRAVYLAVRDSRESSRPPKSVRCEITHRDDKGHPVLRSARPLGQPFDVIMSARMTARMVDSKHRFSRIVRPQNVGQFLVIRLLRDDPALTYATVNIKWIQKTRPWGMQILSVVVHCEEAR